MLVLVRSRYRSDGAGAGGVHRAVRGALPVGAGAGVPGHHPDMHVLVLRVARRAAAHAGQELRGGSVRLAGPSGGHVDLHAAHRADLQRPLRRTQRHRGRDLLELHVLTSASALLRRIGLMTVPL